MNAYKHEMRRAVRDCSERGLYEASKWVAEFLLVYQSEGDSLSFTASSLSKRSVTLSEGSNPDVDMSLGENVTPQPQASSSSTTPGSTQTPHPPLLSDEPMNEDTSDLFAVARCYYDSKEHERVDHLLRFVKHPKARFLGLYSRFLASEKRAHDVWLSRKEAKPDPRKPELSKPPAPINTELSGILECLTDTTDPFLLFLKAAVLKGLRCKAEAIESAIRSLQMYPWNRSCWDLLWELVDDHDVIDRMLPLLPRDHPATKIFLIGIKISSHAMTEELEQDLEELVETLPRSLTLRSLQAHYAHSIRDIATSIAIFEEILEADPYRTDGVDTYSNILYTEQKQAKLSQLAQHFMGVNKDRPEVSMVIGNYYSLRNEHEKAIRYFHRAVTLHPSYGAAWTLMGHEYLEMKNSHAAIEAYRRCIDISKKDYRAWHGLGQAYELLDMPQYALHYFQRSCALRPYDIRMWRALAKTYQTLKQYREAIECQKRALLGASKTDTFGYASLAELHEALNEDREASEYHRQVVLIYMEADRERERAFSGIVADESKREGDQSFADTSINIPTVPNAATVGLWAKSAIAVGQALVRRSREVRYPPMSTEAIRRAILARYKSKGPGISHDPPLGAVPERSEKDIEQDLLKLKDDGVEARRWLEIVAGSNAAEANEAEGLLRLFNSESIGKSA